MRKNLFILTLTFLIVGAAKAQLHTDSTKTDPSLNGQYQLLLSKSRSLDGYKLINPYRLSVFWKNVKDSLADSRRQSKDSKIAATKYQAQIDTLKNQVAGTETSLASSNAKLNEISFMGLSFSKSGYNIFVWSFIGILIIALFVVIFRSAKNIREATYRTGLYEEIHQEYQNYKAKANEKEKKLARELQDERNKLEELKNHNR